MVGQHNITGKNFLKTIQLKNFIRKLKETYGTTVEHGCINGSKFDTDKDGKGDQSFIRSECLWNKVWTPYPSLPPCIITHCIEPFPIPADTFLETISPEWTPIKTNKKYRCQGMKEDGNHTMYWESDRSKSTFEMLCLEDGTFQFVNERGNWPTCVIGKCHFCIEAC